MFHNSQTVTILIRLYAYFNLQNYNYNGCKPFCIVKRIAAKGLKVHMRYTFECQYAKPINTAWNGSLPQANAGDIFIATPLV